MDGEKRILYPSGETSGIQGATSEGTTGNPSPKPPASHAIPTREKERQHCGGLVAQEAKQWMRIDEAAHYSRLGVSLLRKLIHNKQLPAIRTGRYYVIERADLDACLQKMKPHITKKK